MGMAQHFLLSSAAKSLTLGQVARMSDGEVERVFIRLRWQDNGGQAYCPKCGCTTVYEGRRRGMTTYTLTELFNKRAEIAGLIVQGEKQVRQLRADLAHVEATIRILRPGTELPKIVPKRVEFRPRYFKRGQLTRLIRDHLRDHAGEAVAVADIMPAAVGDRNLNSAEYRRVEIVVYEALKKLAKRGTVRQIGQGAKLARWRLSAEL